MGQIEDLKTKDLLLIFSHGGAETPFSLILLVYPGLIILIKKM